MTESTRTPATYDVHPSVVYVATLLSNLQEKTGRSVDEWSDLIHLERPSDPKAWLSEIPYP
jgi:hypothetical protein